MSFLPRFSFNDCLTLLMGLIRRECARDYILAGYRNLDGIMVVVLLRRTAIFFLIVSMWVLVAATLANT